MLLRLCAPCPRFMTCGYWPILIASLTSLCFWLLSMSTTFASSKSMSWLAFAVWSVTVLLLKHVSNDFRSDQVYTYITFLASFWCSLGLLLNFCPLHLQISLRIRTVWPEPSLAACWITADFLHADNENSDQTVRMRILIWVFVWLIFRKVRLLICGFINVSVCFV